MAKARINLMLDRGTFEAARDLLALVPGDASVSELVNDFLGDFVAKIGPVLERAQNGDSSAALALLQLTAARDLAEVTSGLVELSEAIHTKRPVEAAQLETAK